MSPFNRREFLYSSVAISAATTIAPHLPAMLPKGAWQPSKPVWQEANTRPRDQSQFERDRGFVNWREQGLNFGGNAFRNPETFRL